MQDHERR